MQRTPLHSPPVSLPSSPVLKAASHNIVPFVAPLDQHDVEPHLTSQGRLLIPEVRPNRLPQQRHYKAKGGILSRPNRSSSIASELHNPPRKSWVSSLGKLHVVQEHLQLCGYQMYAVEKWYFFCLFPLRRIH